VKTLAAAVVLVVAALAAVVASGATAPHGAQADPTKFFCVFSKSVTAEGHTASTPTICVPSP